MSKYSKANSLLDSVASDLGLASGGKMNLNSSVFTKALGKVRTAAGAVQNYTAGSHLGAARAGYNVQRQFGKGRMESAMFGAQMGWHAAGSTAKAGYMGAGAGAAWGVASDDTSVLGGAMIGAGAGAGGVAAYGARHAARWMGIGAFARSR